MYWWFHWCADRPYCLPAEWLISPMQSTWSVPACCNGSGSCWTDAFRHWRLLAVLWLIASYSLIFHRLFKDCSMSADHLADRGRMSLPPATTCCGLLPIVFAAIRYRPDRLQATSAHGFSYRAAPRSRSSKKPAAPGAMPTPPATAPGPRWPRGSWSSGSDR